MSLKKERETHDEMERVFRHVDSIRREHDLSYRQLSAKSGVAHATYWNWASGKSPPTLFNFLRYLRTLGLKMTIERI